MAIETILLITAILLLLSIVASKASGRLGVPALVLFLVIGMLAGSDGPGGIYFDDPWVAQFIGTVALVFILFSGGLDTAWTSIRPIVWPGVSLATVGVLLTSLLVGSFAAWVLGYSWLEGLLFGAIVSSTDAAAVFTVLRSRGVGLRGRLAPLLEFESGSNDPMAVFLTVSLTGLLTTVDASVGQKVLLFFWQMGLGVLLGYGAARAAIVVLNRVRLEFDGLYPVLSLTLVLLTFGLTTTLGGNGFLAVYIAGLTIGNRDFVHKRSLMRFHDGVAWLMQIGMFLVLGLLVFPSQLVPVAGVGVLIALFLIFVARPVSVFVALIGTPFDTREKAMIAWTGLRGAVPIVLATFPLLANVQHADTIFNLVFFVVLTSVVFQGTTIPLIARWLGVQAKAPAVYHYPLEFVPTVNANSRLTEIPVPHGAVAVGQSIMELGLPTGALIVLVHRQGETIVPSGSLIIEPDDRMLVLANQDVLPDVQQRLTHRGSEGVVHV